MYTQRLFNVLYPVVKENSQIMMQLCGMVSLQMLENQGKLQELLPIAQETLSKGLNISNKITALSLFRKILMQAIQPDSSIEQKEKAISYLDQLLPSLFTILCE